MQKIATTGNATIIVYDDVPLLATDPWIGDERVVVSRKLDETRSRDPRGDVPALLGTRVAVPGPVQHQGRALDRR